MGYALYWNREIEFKRDAFERAVEDVVLILSRLSDMGVRLAGPAGKGKPQLGPETIAFNGSVLCGHRYRDLGKPRPSATATGVEEKEPPYDPKAEPWMSGPFLETRVCGGNCAGDPFFVDRKYIVRDWERTDDEGRYVCECETHFKPYDLAVAAVLVRLKEHLGDAIVIASQNDEHGFEDAKRLCRELFGWASKFEIEKPEREVLL